MDLAQYRRINNIIERDSADATYKYALLRGVIEICQQFSHLREEDGDQVSFPLGLLVEKWLLYYYPIFAAPTFIPQKNGETQDLDAGKTISFRKHFAPVIDYYRDRGGISVFYSDYIRGSVPEEIGPAFRILVKEIRNTIVRMPMKHLGYSQSKEHYSVFDYDRPLYRLSSDSPVDRSHLIENFGRFFLSRDLCTVFATLGPSPGEECLLKKWAASSADKTGTVTEECMFLLNRDPTTERAIADARNIYRSPEEGGRSPCLVRKAIPHRTRCTRPCPPARSGTTTSENFPALICQCPETRPHPDPALLNSRKEHVIGYWGLLHDHVPRPFEREISVSLLGLQAPRSDWQDRAFEHLTEKCAYLIDVRGYAAWAI